MYTVLPIQWIENFPLIRKQPLFNISLTTTSFHLDTLTTEKTRILTPLGLVKGWDLITNCVLLRFLWMKLLIYCHLKDKATFNYDYERN